MILKALEEMKLVSGNIFSSYNSSAPMMSDLCLKLEPGHDTREINPATTKRYVTVSDRSLHAVSSIIPTLLLLKNRIWMLPP